MNGFIKKLVDEKAKIYKRISWWESKLKVYTSVFGSLIFSLNEIQWDRVNRIEAKIVFRNSVMKLDHRIFLDKYFQ